MRGGAFLRQKEPTVDGIHELRPTNHVYGHLLSYRTYHLASRREPRSLRSSTVKINLDNLKHNLGDIGFTRSDPISILDFLAMFAKHADQLHLKDYETYKEFPKFLSGDARLKFRSAQQQMTTYSRSVEDVPAAVHFLLKKFTSNKHIKVPSKSIVRR